MYDSWGWKILLAIRDLIRDNVKSIIGDMKVNEMIYNGKWRWPEEWYVRFPMITNIAVPVLVDEIADRIIWRDRNGKDMKFSVHTAYNDMTDQHPVVTWWKLIWFSQYVTCASRTLKILITSSSNVPSQKAYGLRSIVRRTAFAACIYSIWQERNGRIFRDERRNCDDVFKSIVDKVRHRLLGLTVKDSLAVRDTESKWGNSCKEEWSLVHQGEDLKVLASLRAIQISSTSGLSDS
ncbi:hypothetical protein Tco_0501955 [Tanacetum coccineum]